MSEQSLGDISNNRVHQMLESLQAGGFSVDLFHRLRLDKEYREAFIVQAQSLDKEIIGEEQRVEYDQAFCHPVTIIRALRERSPYRGIRGRLPGDEVLLRLCDKRPLPRTVPEYPLKLYTMTLYKRMSRAEIRNELRRRGLVSASTVDALCLATRFCINDGDCHIRVMDAEVDNPLFDRENLCFGRTVRGDPILYLGGFSILAGDYVEQDARLLVKRAPA